MTKIDYSATADYHKEERKDDIGKCLLTPVAPKMDCRLDVRPSLPGTVIVSHGVNDVGVGYGMVEAGICAGLAARLGHDDTAIVPAKYSMPPERGNTTVEEDPDALFFKRKADENTHSPVIPFYWGFREEKGKIQDGNDLPHGQNLDRYGNRLDKDNSKEGGPFANATNTLLDMWNKGHGSLPQTDPIRPTLKAPGRLYMILAAQRMASLVSMIKDYHPDEVVNIVAHSQGTLISLLAQAFLLDSGRKPADTLVLCNSPYGLEDCLTDIGFHGGGDDALMRGRYKMIDGDQTLHARLQTLVNIVKGVSSQKGSAPAYGETLKAPEARGMVGGGWQASADRDNRGMVYVYFTPEDVTVNLRGMQGMGWQGVPDVIGGTKVQPSPYNPKLQVDEMVILRPMDMLMATGGFFQRVFTVKKRPDFQKGEPVLVGAPPYEFALNVKGEDFYSHVDKFGRFSLNRAARTSPDSLQDSVDSKRHLIRRINGEALKTPVRAELLGGALLPSELPEEKCKAPFGAYESVDPVDAAIASAGDGAYHDVWQLMDDPSPEQYRPFFDKPVQSLQPKVYAGFVSSEFFDVNKLKALLNEGKPQLQCADKVFEASRCLVGSPSRPSGKLLIRREETPEEVRRRYQTSESGERSFHSSIFANDLNHKQVTAYDLSIGQGAAVDDPEFRDYLCAVADWRLKKPEKNKPTRPGILLWDDFIKRFGKFYDAEPPWRKNLIERTSHYYSTGELPMCVALLPEGLPSSVVCETKTGRGARPDPMIVGTADNYGDAPPNQQVQRQA